MKLFVLSEESLNAVLTYLGTRPLAEVAQLYNTVRAAQLLTNSDGTPFEPTSEVALETLPEAAVAPEASNESGKEASA